jgi:hypothetical protein
MVNPDAVEPLNPVLDFQMGNRGACLPGSVACSADEVFSSGKKGMALPTSARDVGGQ